MAAVAPILMHFYEESTWLFLLFEDEDARYLGAGRDNATRNLRLESRPPISLLAPEIALEPTFRTRSSKSMLAPPLVRNKSKCGLLNRSWRNMISLATSSENLFKCTWHRDMHNEGRLRLMHLVQLGALGAWNVWLYPMYQALAIDKLKCISIRTRISIHSTILLNYFAFKYTKREVKKRTIEPFYATFERFHASCLPTNLTKR